MVYTAFEEGVRTHYRPHFLEIFAGVMEKEAADAAIKKFDELYQAILLRTPDDGGTASPNHHNTVEAACVLAFYFASDKRFGAKGTVDLYTCQMLYLPGFVQGCRKTGSAMFTEEWQAARKDQTVCSLDYAHGFHLRFVPCEERTSFGVDYLSCPIVDMMKREGAQELQPYLCAMDYVFADLMGFRLERKQTLGAGGKLCDFRYHKL